MSENPPTHTHTSPSPPTQCLELLLLLAAARFSKVVSPLDTDGVFLSPISTNSQISRIEFGAIFSRRRYGPANAVTVLVGHIGKGTILERRGARHKAKHRPCSSFPRSCWTGLTADNVWKRIGAERVEQIHSPFTRRPDC